MCELYKEYAITGMLVEYWPPFNPGSSGTYISASMYASGLDKYEDQYEADPNDFLGQAGCRSFMPNRKFRQYISFRKISRQDHAEW